MPSRLTNKDYISILNYYNINIPKSKILIRKQAEKIMAEKLCKCIKKIDTENEAKSIGICTKPYLIVRGILVDNFSVKKNKLLNSGKKIKIKL